jgi:hypothetical protein
MDMAPQSVFPEPPLALVKVICGNSPDLSLKKAKFFRYMEKYAMQGLCCRRPKRLTPERRVYYEGIRKKELERFARKNRDNIERLRKSMLETKIYGS